MKKHAVGLAVATVLASAGVPARGKGWYSMQAAAKDTAEVYIYGEIGPWGITASAFVTDLRNAVKGMKNLIVRVSSPGGSIMDGLAIYNAIRDLKLNVTTVIDALAASMGSIIALAGQRVQMRDNALYMIHKPWTWAAGDAEDLRKQADLLDKNEINLTRIYARKCGMPDDEINALLAAETWYTAQEAMEAGFVDEVIESLDDEQFASLSLYDTFDLQKYTNLQRAPAALFSLFSPKQSLKEHDDMKRINDIPAQANVPAGAAPVAPAATAPIADPQAAVAAALVADANRRKGIRDLFAKFGTTHDTLRDECENDQSCSIDSASQKLLAAMAAQHKQPGPVGGGSRIEVGQSDSEKFIIGATAALSMRAGFEKMDGSNEFRGYSLREIARAALQRSRISDGGMDTMTMIGVAFTHSTSDFTKILENVAHKALLKGAEEAGETFQLWTSKGTLTDFKVAKRASLNDFPTLLEVPEGAEYKYASVGDRGESVQLATYGRRFSISRQAIINDDLGAFTKIPRAMSRAAYRTIGNLVYAILTGNPTMSDGIALFHASHGNIGTAATLSATTLDEMRKLMSLQKDASSQAVTNITPAHLIVPSALKGLAMQVTKSETDISKANSKVPNIAMGIADVICDARLDAVSATGYFMTADQNQFDTIEVQYLDGVDTPVLEQMNGWNVDGIEYKVRMDAGVKALDYRTIAKNVGA